MEEGLLWFWCFLQTRTACFLGASILLFVSGPRVSLPLWGADRLPQAGASRSVEKWSCTCQSLQTTAAPSLLSPSHHSLRDECCGHGLDEWCGHGLLVGGAEGNRPLWSCWLSDILKPMMTHSCDSGLLRFPVTCTHGDTEAFATHLSGLCHPSAPFLASLL